MEEGGNRKSRKQLQLSQPRMIPQNTVFFSLSRFDCSWFCLRLYPWRRADIKLPRNDVSVGNHDISVFVVAEAKGPVDDPPLAAERTHIALLPAEKLAAVTIDQIGDLSQRLGRQGRGCLTPNRNPQLRRALHGHHFKVDVVAVCIEFRVQNRIVLTASRGKPGCILGRRMLENEFESQFFTFSRIGHIVSSGCDQ